MDAQKYMLRCLELAQKASDEDEVPIGAAVVDPESGEIVSEAYNSANTNSTPPPMPKRWPFAEPAKNSA